MSEFKYGDILECIDDYGLQSCLGVGKMYTFEKYNDDKSRVYLKGLEFKALSSRFIKAQEKEVDTIKLTYAEAWEALCKDKEVFYNHFHDGSPCILENGFIKHSGKFAVPFHPTDKLFTMKKEPEYEVIGLHDDCVEIEVFGLKTYQITGSFVYFLDNNGFINIDGDGFDRYIGRVKFKGDHTKAKVKVTVDTNKNITYEHI